MLASRSAGKSLGQKLSALCRNSAECGSSCFGNAVHESVLFAKTFSSTTKVQHTRHHESASRAREFFLQQRSNGLPTSHFQKNLFEGSRQHSSAPKSSNSVSEVQQKLGKLMGSPTEAIQSAKNAYAKASASAYQRVPKQVKQLMQSATQPGKLQQVLKLQLEAFWGNHGRKVLALGGVVLIYVLWRSLFKFASIFLNLSETIADFGFLAFAAAAACFAYLYVRRLYSINPQSVYRLAMLQLNTNPAVLEVMGAPVAGSSVRALVQTGGGLRLKGLRPRIRSRRLQMIFPLTGSERRGLVSLEAKKLKGRYMFKLLAVDVPSTSGQEQRLFLEGDEKSYERGGVLGELRDPFLQAIQLRDDNELEDEIDDAAEEAKASHEKRVKEIAKLQRAPKPLDDGGGMYVYERAYWAVRRFLAGSKFPDSNSSAAGKSGVAAGREAGQKAPESAVNPANVPTPSSMPAEKLHQFKKEASAQQAP